MLAEIFDVETVVFRWSFVWNYDKSKICLYIIDV
jgi:hypothetical protein